jgi:hypothetical protein
MAQTTGQNYGNHTRLLPLFHYVLLPLITATLIGSFVNLAESICHCSGLYSASLICCLSIFSTLAYFYMRQFAIKAQDRAIRAEENFRHFILTGKPHDVRLKLGQIIGLRFAPDEEMPTLAIRAVAENMKPDDIKKAIVNWKGDYNRV